MRILIPALCLIHFGLFAEGEGSLFVPDAFEKAQIIDKAGTMLPLDIKLTDHQGKELLFGDYFKEGEERPVILMMLYFGCPRLCNLALNGLGDVLQKMSQKPGKAYRVLAVSIDEREGVSNAFDKRAVYLKSWNFKPDEEEAVIFHTASASESKRLADSLGFNYFYDKRDDQFAHGAGIFFLSSSPDKKGLLARTLFGIEFKPNDVKLALSEASLGKFGSFLDRVILSCFHYEPDSQRYGIYIMGVMRLGGVLTMLIVGSFLLISFRGERRRAAVLK